MGGAYERGRGVVKWHQAKETDPFLGSGCSFGQGANPSEHNKRRSWQESEKQLLVNAKTTRNSYRWWKLFSHMQGFGGKFSMNHSPPTVYFSSEGQLVHTNATLSARISPQWLSELRWLWQNVGQKIPLPSSKYSLSSLLKRELLS